MFPPVIGVAGTAKNTGKTTTVSALIKQIYYHNMKPALTTIGFDGEEIDNITLLPKPKFFLQKRTLLATAEKCLTGGSARIDTLEKTGILTPLGEILIGKVARPGTAVIAGPQKRTDLEYVIDIFKKYKSDIILVDGALNRLMPMLVTHGIILATGAARNIEPETIAAEVQAIRSLLKLKKYSLKTDIRKSPFITCFGPDKMHCQLPSTSLFEDETALAIARKLNKGFKGCYIPGAVNLVQLKKLLQQVVNLNFGKLIVFHDPLRLVISGEPSEVDKVIFNYQEKGGAIGVLNSVKLIAITLNPFYPGYKRDKNLYYSAFIDGKKLKDAIKEKIDLPVIDIKTDGSEKLFQILLKMFFAA